MSLEIDVVYEDGVLKPDHPLPFQEHQRVRVVVRGPTPISDRLCGLMAWTGDAALLRTIVEDPEFGVQGGP